MSWQHASFDQINGRQLRDGSLIATESTFGNDPAPFDVETLTLRMDTDSATISGNFGLSDRLDIGAAIALVRISLKGERVDTYRGDRLLQASASSTVSGIGDLALRFKYNVMRGSGNGLAIGAETRLPTGDEENLLGTGEVSFKPRIIWSMESKGVALDTKLGYSFGGLSDELTYGGAVTVVGTPKFLMFGEISGRRLGSVGRLTETTSTRNNIKSHPAVVNRSSEPTRHRGRRLQVESRSHLARRGQRAQTAHHRGPDRAVGTDGVHRIRVRRVTIWMQGLIAPSDNVRPRLRPRIRWNLFTPEHEFDE